MKAKKGESILPEIIEVFLSSSFFMPSVELVDEQGKGFVPLFFDRDGIPMVAVFTDKSRSDIHQSKIRDLIIISLDSIIV